MKTLLRHWGGREWFGLASLVAAGVLAWLLWPAGSVSLLVIGAILALLAALAFGAWGVSSFAEDGEFLPAVGPIILGCVLAAAAVHLMALAESKSPGLRDWNRRHATTAIERNQQ